MKMILNPEYRLYERDGKAFCSSRQVAEEFGKRHADVLRAIEKITAPTSGVSAEFNERNFALVTYKDAKGERRPEYLMTKDGFAILAMGFTGKKAMRFKEAYIRRFNEMEAFIRSLQTAKMEFPAFTEAIMAAHDEPRST